MHGGRGGAGAGWAGPGGGGSAAARGSDRSGGRGRRGPVPQRRCAGRASAPGAEESSADSARGGRAENKPALFIRVCAWLVQTMLSALWARKPDRITRTKIPPHLEKQQEGMQDISGRTGPGGDRRSPLMRIQPGPLRGPSRLRLPRTSPSNSGLKSGQAPLPASARRPSPSSRVRVSAPRGGAGAGPGRWGPRGARRRSSRQPGSTRTSQRSRKEKPHQPPQVCLCSN